jgi:hypothetical protein
VDRAASSLGLLCGLFAVGCRAAPGDSASCKPGTDCSSAVLCERSTNCGARKIVADAGAAAAHDSTAGNGQVGAVDAAGGSAVPNLDAAAPDASDQAGFPALRLPCEPGQRACPQLDSRLPLVCMGDKWVDVETCGVHERCDTRAGATRGRCVDVVPECDDKGPGFQFCRGYDRMTCGLDRLTTTAERCPIGQGCELNHDKATCVADADECAAGAISACGQGATACTNTAGSYGCTCADGYTGSSGTACKKILDCSDNAVFACETGMKNCQKLISNYPCACTIPNAAALDGQCCCMNGWSTAVFSIGTVNSSGTLAEPGQAFGLWSNAGASFVYARHYSTSNGWDASLVIDGANDKQLFGPNVASDGLGNAVAVWLRGVTTPDSIWASRYMLGNGWDNPVQLGSGNAFAPPPSVASDASGNAIAIWALADTVDTVRASRYAAGGAWTNATTIGTSATQASGPPNQGAAPQPCLAMDARGNAIAVWHQLDGQILSNRYVAGSGWGTATRINEQDGYLGALPALAVDTAGNAVAVWQQHGSIQSNRFLDGVGWGTATTIDGSMGGMRPTIAVDDSGNAIAVWTTAVPNDVGHLHVWASRFEVGSVWATAMQIDRPDFKETLNVFSYEPLASITIDAKGNAIVFWNSGIAAGKNRYRRYLVGTGWGPETILMSDIVTDAIGRIPVVVVDGSRKPIAIAVMAAQ